MSAKRSKHTEMLRRFDAQTKRWTEQIERQKGIIDRLLAANVAYADGLHEVVHDVKDVRAARKVAGNAIDKAKAILAVDPATQQGSQKEN